METQRAKPRLVDVINKILQMVVTHPGRFYPGGLIGRLKPHEIEVLKQAKAKDFYHRIK